MSRTRRLGVLLSAVLPAVSLIGAVSAAAQGDGAATATGVVTYQENLDHLPGAVLRAEQGTKDPRGGCQFDNSGREHVAAGPQVLVFTEVSYNPTACTRVVASARYRPDAVPPAVAARLAANDQPGSGSAQQEAAAVQPATKTANDDATVNYHGRGYLQVWFEDPIYIDLSLTKSTLDWQWGPAPYYPLIGWTYHEAYWYWFGLSGWRLDSYNRQFVNNGVWAFTDTIGHFSNPVFCLGDTTYADHYETQFFAMSGGYFGWSYRVAKSGGCSGPIQMPGFYSWAVTIV